MMAVDQAPFIASSTTLLEAALLDRSVPRPPVWVMRQAGRILPEYRALRKSVSGFKELVSTPELAAEVTMQPVRKLGVDAAIIFSDILVIPEAMGLPYTMDEGRGPHFENTIESVADIDKLCVSDGTELQFVADAITLCKRELSNDKPVIGFAGAPFTVFCYMCEGRGSKTFSTARRWLHAEPKASHRLLAKITETTINYLRVQARAGVACYQLFDSWAGVLSTGLYREFCMPYLNQIAEALSPLPGIIFAKDGHFAAELLSQSEFTAIGLDWSQHPETYRELNPKKVLQGNLDPAVLYGTDEHVVNCTLDMISRFGTNGYIANLGHGVYPDIAWEKVKLFIDTIKSHHSSSSL